MAPNGLCEMDAEAHSFRMRQRIHWTANQMLFAADEFAIFAAYRVDFVCRERRTEHSRNLVREETGAIHQAARFSFAGCTHNANSVAGGLQSLDFCIGDDIRAPILCDAGVGFRQFLTADDS